jgi:mRNA interferase MazF
VLLMTRDSVIDTLSDVLVAPITRTLRGIDTEVIHTPEDGMPLACAINFDHVSLARKARLGAVITSLPETRWSEAEAALLVACGFRTETRKRP